jgi:hypothetical protein
MTKNIQNHKKEKYPPKEEHLSFASAKQINKQLRELTSLSPSLPPTGGEGDYY